MAGWRTARERLEVVAHHRPVDGREPDPRVTVVMITFDRREQELFSTDLAAAGWALRHQRQVVRHEVAAGLALLDEQQLTSGARRHVS